MAKPINPYQGPAPAAMAMMGQGLSEAGANIGRSLQSGYDSLGKGLAGGINAAVSQYAQHKDDQAKFDATKKLFNAFESYLPKQKDPETGKEFSPMADQIRSMFDDTSMSVREKNAMAPMLLNFLGNAQQQAGRESVANIMAGSRVQAAETRRPGPVTGTSFGGVPTLNSVFDAPVGQPQADTGFYNLPTNPSQGNPAALQQGQPASRMTPDGRMEVWSSRLNKYVEIDNPMQDIQF